MQMLAPVCADGGVSFYSVPTAAGSNVTYDFSVDSAGRFSDVSIGLRAFDVPAFRPGAPSAPTGLHNTGLLWRETGHGAFLEAGLNGGGVLSLWQGGGPASGPFTDLGPSLAGRIAHEPILLDVSAAPIAALRGPFDTPSDTLHRARLLDDLETTKRIDGFVHQARSTSVPEIPVLPAIVVPAVEQTRPCQVDVAPSDAARRRVGGTEELLPFRSEDLLREIRPPRDEPTRVSSRIFRERPNMTRSLPSVYVEREGVQRALPSCYRNWQRAIRELPPVRVRAPMFFFRLPQVWMDARRALNGA